MLQLRNFNTLNTTSNKVYLNKQGRWKIKNKPSIKRKRKDERNTSEKCLMLQLRNFNTINTTSNKVYLNKQGRWKIKNKPSIKRKRNKMKEIQVKNV